MKSKPEQTSIPFSRLGRNSRPPVIVDLMARALANPELLSLAAGFTDNVVLPAELVARFAAELTAEPGNEALQYGQNQGRQRLRELTCAFLATHPNERAEAYDPANTLITNGSQQALYIAVQTLCDPGDIILVEQPSYFVCLEMLQGLGVRAIGMPCDAKGAIRHDALAAQLRELEHAGERDRVKAIYLVSYFGNPSSRCHELDEKRATAKTLLDAGYCIPVIEDAAYRDLYYEAPHPVPTTLSLDAYAPFPKLYLGTFTKPFATGLKIGYGVCTDAAWLDKMLCIKGHQDFGSAHFNQCLIERMLAGGHYPEHLAGIQKHYATKADVMDRALREGGLPELGWQWERPQGGLIFWLRGPAGIDLRMEGEFCQRCIENGVLYVPGDLCFAAGAPWNCVRLSTGALLVARLKEAVARFVSVAKDFS